MVELLQTLLNKVNLENIYFVNIIAIALVLFFWNFIKQNELFKSVTNFYSNIINKKMNELSECIDSDIYNENEKKFFRHRRKVLGLKKILGLIDNNLELLQYMNGFEDYPAARKSYNNGYDYLAFNHEKKCLELKDDIDESKAKLHEKIGGLYFMFNGFLSYLILISPTILFPEHITPKTIGWLLPLFITLALGQFYVGFKVMKYSRKKQDALNILKMRRIETDEEEN